MKKLCFLLLALLAMPLMSEPILTSLKNQEEFLKNWQLVESDAGEKDAYQEWIPQGETDTQWTKSFGIQSYQLESNYDLINFYNLFIDTLSKDFEAQNQPFFHEILDQNDKHLIFSWWCDHDSCEVGREWIHLTKAENNTIFFVRFATKASDISAEDQIWRDCMAEVNDYENATLFKE